MITNYLKSNTTFLLISIIMSILTLSCSKKDRIKNQTIESHKIYYQLSDSSYIYQVSDFYYTHNKLVISDYRNNRIIFTDTSFNLLKVLGGLGGGPGEFKGVLGICFGINNFFAIDDGNKRINVFSMEGNYLKEIHLPKGQTVLERITTDRDENIYFSSPLSSYPITKMNAKGEVLQLFGNWVQTENIKERKARNNRHLLMTEKNVLINVYKSEPIVEVYNTKGNFINSIDLSNIDAVKSRINFVKAEYQQNPINKISTYILFADAYYCDDKLYLLVVDNLDGYVKCNKVVVVSKFDKVKIPTKILTLSTKNGTKWFSKICVFKDHLFAFNERDSGIYDFRITE